MRRLPSGAVELVGAGDRDDAHARDPRRLGRVPLQAREVGDLVALGGQALGEVAVPALGAADGPGEQAVVDEADPHGQRRAGWQTGRRRYPSAADQRDFAVRRALYASTGPVRSRGPRPDVRMSTIEHVPTATDLRCPPMRRRS